MGSRRYFHKLKKKEIKPFFIEGAENEEGWEK